MAKKLFFKLHKK